MFGTYGAQTPILALTIFLALIGVVTFGTLAGSMLPFILRRLGLNPASASAPFVATLVDVTGLIIYFTIADFVMLQHLRAKTFHNVFFKDSVIRYHGGPVNLENVHFINCRFLLDLPAPQHASPASTHLLMVLLDAPDPKNVEIKR